MTHSQTGDSLLQTVLRLFNDGKKVYPKSLIAVEIDNALYFLYNDAELVSNLYCRPVDEVKGVPMCIIPKAEHNDLSLCLYENKFLMAAMKDEDELEAFAGQPAPSVGPNWGNFFEYVVENIVKPYNKIIQQNFKQEGK